MPTPLRALLAALLILTGIFGVANLAAEVPVWDAWNTLDGSGDEVNLRITRAEQGELSYGTLVELYRFDLGAELPYSLRNAVFAVESAGLELSDWQVFEELHGEVNYREPVALREDRHDDLLHLRFSSEPGVAFLGTRRRHHFIMTGTVGSLPGADPELIIQPLETDWTWAYGHEVGAWLEVEESVTGL